MLSLFQGMRPPPRLTVTEWADRYRVLSSVSTAEYGPWKTNRTPYLKEIMDTMSPFHPARRIVFMKGSQIGGSEVVYNAFGYAVDLHPSPIMVVMPDLTTVKKVSRTRIDPMIEACPSLRAKIGPAKSRDARNSIYEKHFPGGVAVFVGAQAGSGLRSTPIRWLILDEVDAFPFDVEEDGDPVELAIQRTVSFGNRKIIEVSTPLIKGTSRIERDFLLGDQRHFYVPCPHCLEMQTLEWENVRWPEGKPREAFYACPHCGGVIDEYRKDWMLPRGEWRAHNTDADPDVASFYLSALYSPYGWPGSSWGQIAWDRQKAEGSPALLKAWTNLKLGLPYDEEATRVDPQSLLARAEKSQYGRDNDNTLPAGVAVLFAGVDVQGDRLEVEVLGMGRDEETWSILYRVIQGDPNRQEVWEELDDLLTEKWPHARETDDMGVSAVCIDMGGHHTQRVLQFTANKVRRKVWAIKGATDPAAPAWPKHGQRRSKKYKGLYALIGVSAIKETVYGRLALREPGPGYCHFPYGRGPEYFKQLTAEKMVTQYTKGYPKRVWHKDVSARNEALDCRTYAMAAFYGRCAEGFNLDRAVARLEEFPVRSNAVAIEPPPKVLPLTVADAVAEKPARKVRQSSGQPAKRRSDFWGR